MWCWPHFVAVAFLLETGLPYSHLESKIEPTNVSVNLFGETFRGTSGHESVPLHRKVPEISATVRKKKKSGTSLIEQIIASHDDVNGCGELQALSDAVSANTKLNGPDLSIERYRDVARHYLASDRLANVKKRYFTDKMPINYRYLFLILSSIPIEDSWLYLYNQGKLGGLISLGAISNLLIFFLSIKKNKISFATGIVIASLLIVLLIFIIKYL